MAMLFDVDAFNASVARSNGMAECPNGHSAVMPSNSSSRTDSSCIIDVDAFNATLGYKAPEVKKPEKEEHHHNHELPPGWTEEQYHAMDDMYTKKAEQVVDYLSKHPDEMVEYANTGRLRFDPFVEERQQATGVFREPTPDEVVFGNFDGASCFRNPSEDVRNKEMYEEAMRRENYRNAVNNIPMYAKIPQSLQYVDPNSINPYRYAADTEKQNYFFNKYAERNRNIQIPWGYPQQNMQMQQVSYQQPQQQMMYSPIAAAQEKKDDTIYYTADLSSMIQQQMNEENASSNDTWKPGEYSSGYEKMLQDAETRKEADKARAIAMSIPKPSMNDYKVHSVEEAACAQNSVNLATVTRTVSHFDPNSGKYILTNPYTGWQKMSDNPHEDFEEELIKAGILTEDGDVVGQTNPFEVGTAPDITGMPEMSDLLPEDVYFNSKDDDDIEESATIQDLFNSGEASIDPNDPSHIVFNLNPTKPKQKVKLSGEEESFRKSLLDDSTLDTGYTSDRYKAEEAYNKMTGCNSCSPATFNPVTGEIKPGYYEYLDANGNSYRTQYNNPYATPTLQNYGFYNGPNSVFGYANNAYMGQNDYNYAAIDSLLAYEDSLNPRYTFDVMNAWKGRAINAWSSAENEPIYTLQIPVGDGYHYRTVMGTKSELNKMKQSNEIWRQRNIDIGCWLTKKACTYLGKEYDEKKVAERFDPYYSPYSPQEQNPMVGKAAIDKDRYRSWMEEEKAAVNLMNFSRSIDDYNDYNVAIKRYACSKIQENYYRSLGLKPGDPCPLDYYLDHGWKIFADNRGVDMIAEAKNSHKKHDHCASNDDENMSVYIGLKKDIPYLVDSPLAKLCGSRDPKTQLDFLKKMNYDPDNSKSFLLLPSEKGLETCLIPPGLDKEAREVFRWEKMMEYVKKGNYGGMDNLTGVGKETERMV